MILLTALREIIFVIYLLHELASNSLPIHNTTPKITCKNFEDNTNCPNIATENKYRPRTKNLSIRLHHFRLFKVEHPIIIENISTRDQVTNIFTKPLPKPQFQKIRKPLCGW